MVGLISILFVKDSTGKPPPNMRMTMTSQTVTRQNFSSGGQYESVFGYSRAVRVGNHLHISGTCASPDYEHSNAFEQAQAILVTVNKVLADAA